MPIDREKAMAATVSEGSGSYDEDDVILHGKTKDKTAYWVKLCKNLVEDDSRTKRHLYGCP